jgi:hypothetical protein
VSHPKNVHPSRRYRILLLATLLALPSANAILGETVKREDSTAPLGPKIRFEEIGERAGVRFVHSTKKFVGRHKRQVLEMFTEGGAAVAVGDYNDDGFDDLFVTNSDTGKTNHLARNNGDLTFTDVTASAGVGGGNDPDTIVGDALWLDYDDDGRLDLLVGRFGTPILYRNEGPGEDGNFRFTDVSEATGLTAFGNTIGMIAFDAEGDGDLDLILANYFQPKNLLTLEDSKDVLPNNLDYADNGGGVSFWRNVENPKGGRLFVDETAKAGFAHHTGWSLDIGHADLDNDGDQDVYVAGDYGTDRLFLNRGDGTFEDTTEESIGFDTKKGMNVDMGDYNRDGFLDIYVTNITDEYMKECNMLWHNNGDGADGPVTFIDLSKETGTCDTDWGWAAKFADFDNDGWEDIFAVDGLRSGGEENYIPLLLNTTIIVPGVDFSDLNSYPDIEDMTWSGYQKQRLFHNLGDGTFKEIGEEAGVATDLDGRGIGLGDFDNDGLLDFYQGNSNQPALFFHSTTENPGSWVALRLVGTVSNHNAIGARVVITASAEGGAAETYLREVNGGNGYSSSSTTRLHFGLGDATRIDAVEIRWPGGKVEPLAAKHGKSPLAINAISRVVEGKGVVQ